MNPWSLSLLILFAFQVKLHLAQEIPLSDNPAIFDDRYKGCRVKMAKIVPSILISENASNELFQDGWRRAIKYWTKIKPNLENLPKGFSDEHGTALVAYTSYLYKAFNEATRDVGTSVQNYKNNYHFKAMHYYLTTAVQMLNNKLKKLVYRGVKNAEFTLSSNSQRVIRFGQFTSSSVDQSVAMKFGNTSFFTIETYLGVDMQRFTIYGSEKEVLIPGYELFRVKSFNRQTHDFKLISKRQSKSRFNCAYWKKFAE